MGRPSDSLILPRSRSQVIEINTNQACGREGVEWAKATIRIIKWIRAVILKGIQVEEDHRSTREVEGLGYPRDQMSP